MLIFGAVVQNQESKWLARMMKYKNWKKSVYETVRIGGRPDSVVASQYDRWQISIEDVFFSWNDSVDVMVFYLTVLNFICPILTSTGTRIFYDRKFLLQCRNSPLTKSPPPNMAQIPGVTCPGGETAGPQENGDEKPKENKRMCK